MAWSYVRIDVNIPPDMDSDVRTAVVAHEKEYSQALQRTGKWAHIWRVVGQYSNISIFNVEDADELHDILWKLPLFQYITVDVQPLTSHPNALISDTAGEKDD